MAEYGMDFFPEHGRADETIIEADGTEVVSAGPLQADYANSR